MELAIVFKREIKENCVIYVPIDIVYKKDNEDKFIYNGKQIHHLLDFNNRKIGHDYFYGYRTNVDEYDDIDIDIEFRIEDIVESEYTLSYINDKEIIIKTNKNNNHKYIFTDNDTNSFGIFDKEYDTKIDINSLYNNITSIVKGQDDQVKEILSTLYFHYKNPDKYKGNTLIVGKSGVGKTKVFKEIEKVLDVPVIIVDMTNITESGYVGGNVDDIIEKLILKTNGDSKKINEAIVVLDEIDKLMEKPDLDSGISTYGVAQSLLKLIEGKEENLYIDGEQYDVDTSKILFVGLGSFASLFKNNNQKQIGFEKELKKDNYTSLSLDTIVDNKGMIPELAGRFENFIIFNNLNKNDYKDILLNSKESPITIWKNIFSEENINLEVNPDVIDYIASKTYNNNFGVRGMIREFNKIIKDLKIDIAFNKDKYNTIYIDINNNGEIKCILKEVKNEYTRNRKKYYKEIPKGNIL